MPMILTAISLVHEMYLAAVSFTVRLLASAYFFVGRMMAAPVSTIMRPLVASPLGYPPHMTYQGATLMEMCS